MKIGKWFLKKGIGLRKLLVFVSELDHSLTKPSNFESLQFVDLDQEKLTEVQEIRGATKAQDLQRLLTLGAIGRAIIIDDKVAAYGLVGFNSSDKPQKLFGSFKIPARSAHIFDCYTFEGHRGKGCYSAVVFELTSLMKKNESCTVYIDCLEDNLAAKKGILRLGYNFTHKLKCYILLNRVIYESKHTNAR